MRYNPFKLLSYFRSSYRCGISRDNIMIVRHIDYIVHWRVDNALKCKTDRFVIKIYNKYTTGPFKKQSYYFAVWITNDSFYIASVIDEFNVNINSTNYTIYFKLILNVTEMHKLLQGTFYNDSKLLYGIRIAFRKKKEFFNTAMKFY